MKALALVSLWAVSQVLSGCDSTVQPGTLGVGTTLAPLSPAATNAMILLGDQAYDSSGNVLTGAIPIGSNVTGSSGALSTTIPLGYYDGTKTFSAQDVNLAAANIISGVTIFGVAGSASGTVCSSANQTGCIANATFPTQSTPTTPAAASTVLSGKMFYAGGAQVTGTMANQGNWNENTTAFPGAGYYSGLTSTLTPALVCTGTSIYGSAGAAVCEATSGGTSATAANVLNGTYFWNSSGASTQGTMATGGNLTGTNASLTVTISAGYYSGTQTASCNDINLTASNIVSSATIFGVTGVSTNSFASYTGSNASRNLATTQITDYAETNTYGSTPLPSGYRDIPDVTKDDDGYSGTNVTFATRPTTACGTTQTTVAARITACATANPTTSTWNGVTYGNAGQGTWKLVTYVGNNTLYTGKNAEVWQDTRTGLLWSSLIAGTTLDSWCKAAGNGQTTGNGYAANDPSGTCNNSTYQPYYANNTAAFSVESYCGETSTIPAVATEATGSTLGGSWSGTYVAAKGGMGAQSSSSSPSVYWRLPTRYDFEQADIDGIRFVMPDMGSHSAGVEWSASIFSTSRGYAWEFFSGLTAYNSTVLPAIRTNTAGVRCIGR